MSYIFLVYFLYIYIYIPDILSIYSLYIPYIFLIYSLYIYIYIYIHSLMTLMTSRMMGPVAGADMPRVQRLQGCHGRNGWINGQVAHWGAREGSS